MADEATEPKPTPAFQLGQRVRVSEKPGWRPRVAGKTGKIGRPPYPISWPSYFRTETKGSGVRRIYWVEFDSRQVLPGAVEGAEVAEADLSPA